MNAPLIWLGLPLIAASFLWLIRRNDWVAGIGGGLAAILSLAAAFLPIDAPVRLGGLSIRIAPVMEILGRRFVLAPEDQPFLIITFGITAFWFFASAAAGVARRLVPMGFAILAFLLGSLAVEPFLYAALLLEMAVLIAVPLLAPPTEVPGRGVIRFLVFQSLAMPFILMAGFLLSGVEASPGDLELVIQSSALLALGFAFLLAIFPFYTWIPMICEEAEPYTVGFILSLFPTIGMLLGLGFLDRYAWLRESDALAQVLRLAGFLMVVSGGLWALFQRHIGRMMGYSVIAQIGFSLLALSLPDQSTGLGIVFILLIPRAVALGVWALGTTVLRRSAPSLMFGDLVGQLRIFPIAGAGVIVSALSLSGVVLLANYPAQQSLWMQVSGISIWDSTWMAIGIVGLFIGAIRIMATLAMAQEGAGWSSAETLPERVFISLGMAALFLMGIFPQWSQPLLSNISKMFELLGR